MVGTIFLLISSPFRQIDDLPRRSGLGLELGFTVQYHSVWRCKDSWSINMDNNEIRTFPETVTSYILTVYCRSCAKVYSVHPSPFLHCCRPF